MTTATQRLRLLAIPLTLILTGLLEAPVHAQGEHELRFVGSQGEEISEEALPADLCSAVKGLPLDRVIVPGKPFALVIARVVLPTDETNLTYSSSLVGRGWHGGMHYLSKGGRYWKSGLRNPVCIRLLDFKNPCKLTVRKMGYMSVSLPVPSAGTEGKVIWMGDISLTRFSAEAGVTVKGEVVTEKGDRLIAPGNVTIRVNGTDDRQKSNLNDGEFSFSRITPGEYLVEFWLDGYSVPTWWVTVAPDSKLVEKRVVASPRRTLNLRLHLRTKSSKDVTVQCGIPYRSTYLDGFPGTRLRVDQSGTRVNLYTPKYRLAVARGPFQDLDSSIERVPAGYRPWFSWSGDLQEGDLVVLLDASDSRRERVVLSSTMRVVGVAEVLAIHDLKAQHEDGQGR